MEGEGQEIEGICLKSQKVVHCNAMQRTPQNPETKVLCKQCLLISTNSDFAISDVGRVILVRLASYT